MFRRSAMAVSAFVLVTLGSAGASPGQTTSGRPTPGDLAGRQASDLARLIDTQGVTGYETDVRTLIERSLPAWAKPRVDEIGNLIVTIGQGSPHTLVTASVDEDGYVVSGVTADGYLRLHRVTASAPFRLFDQFLYGQPVLVRTAVGRLAPGVAGTASTHLLRGVQASSAPRSLDDLFIDVGAASPADVSRLGVRMLDAVSQRERSQVLGGGYVAGVAAQARGNALGLLAVLAGFPARPAVTGTLSVAWTAQGLVGDRGLARLLQQIGPDRVVVVARTPLGRDGDARGMVGRPGAGLVVSEADTLVAEAARQAGVKVQPGLTVKPPAAAIGARVSMAALPILYAQTPVETVNVADIADMAALIRAAAGLAQSGITETSAAWAAGTLLKPPALPASATTPTAGARTEPAIFWTIRPIADAYAVAGHEAAARDAVARLLPSWAKPEVDQHGNLTVTFGKGPRELAFIAHTDEIGYEITAILDDGRATVRKRGGFMDSLMEGHPVLVHASRGIVPAVVAPRPGYAGAAEWQPKPGEVALVFGTSTKAATEALGVAPGDTATVRKRFTPLLLPRATSRSIDNRAGCAVLIEALKRIDPATVGSRVTFAWVVGEETGLEGSRQLAARIRPEYAFAVDTFVSSDSPLDNQRTSLVPLGSGAVLRGMDGASITPADVLTRLQALAATHAIPVTISVTGGGTDASSFTRAGSIPVPISWPGRYSHSPVEVVDARDLDALTRLVVVLATAF